MSNEIGTSVHPPTSLSTDKPFHCILVRILTYGSTPVCRLHKQFVYQRISFVRVKVSNVFEQGGGLWILSSVVGYLYVQSCQLHFWEI